MSIATALGLAKPKVRYAVVGLGDIAQEAMLPGVKHSGNSEVTAFVSGDAEKLAQLGKRWGVKHLYSYDRFDELIASGQIDAIYLATPNWRHAEFILPALAAGIHVLTEKPLEVSVAKSRAILEAAKASTAKLMVAYRLHFEPATLDAIRRIRAGELGELVCFTSCFTQMVDPKNHRAANGVDAGPLLDMGVYPINAARYLFGDEPEEVVSATSVRHPQAGLGEDVDDTLAVTLRFPGGGLAQFTVGYWANAVDSYIIAGTKGAIHMSPGYGFHKPLEQERTIGETQTRESFKETDQFGGQLRYFSDCIREGRDPEPDAEEGLADLRVVEGILRSIETRAPVKLEPFARSKRIDPDAQVQTLKDVTGPEPIGAASPTK